MKEKNSLAQHYFYKKQFQCRIGCNSRPRKQLKKLVVSEMINIALS